MGYRSPYLSHAKSALNHLTYIPTILTPQNHKRPVIYNSENGKAYIPTILTPQNHKRPVIYNSENGKLPLLIMS